MAIRVSQLTEQATLGGTELVPVSVLSTTVTMTSTTLSFDAADNSINDSASQFVIEGFDVNDAVKVTGAADSANNMFSGVIESITAGKIVIKGTVGDAIVTAAAGPSVTISKWLTRRAEVNAIRGTLGTASTLDFSTDGTLAANSDTLIPTQKAVKTYADQLIAAADAMVFKGVTDCSANPNYPAADRGWTYRVSVAGKIGGASGPNVEVGDMFICLTDATSAGTHGSVGSDWSIVQTNLDGAVIGPASSVDGEMVLFDSTTGKLVKRASTTGFVRLASGVASTVDGADDDFVQRKSGVWTNRTLAQVITDLLGSGLTVGSVGTRGLVVNSQSASYTLVASDASKMILHPSGGGSGDVFTIPANSSVAFEVGTAITVCNMDSNTISIAITTDTLTNASDGLTGTRTLAQNGIATLVKVTSTQWLISGTGIS